MAENLISLARGHQEDRTRVIDVRSTVEFRMVLSYALNVCNCHVEENIERLARIGPFELFALQSEEIQRQLPGLPDDAAACIYDFLHRDAPCMT